MSQELKSELVYLRYHLENNAPVDLLDFTESLQALQGEYVRFLKQRGRNGTNARLNIQKVQEGSIIFELIEAALPSVVSIASGANTLVEFGGYLAKMVHSLTKGKKIPAEGYNKESLMNISKFIQPLARNPDSKLEVMVNVSDGSQVTFSHCTFNIDTTEGNALQNRALGAQEELQEQMTRTEELKTNTILRLACLERKADSKQDRGIIEVFDPQKPRKLLFDDETIKARFVESDQNAFKCLYYVDAIAMYQEGRIVAYRIIKLRDIIEPED